MIRVDLDRSRSFYAHQIALNRVIAIHGHQNNEARYDRTKSFHEAIAQHAEGAAAEAVVATYYGEPDYDLSKSSFKETADLELANGLKVEVRWTHWKDGQLIIYPNDRDADVAILVVGTAPTYYITGWIPVIAAKSPRFKHSRQDTWWVPQDNLYPIQDLIRSKYARPTL